MPQKRSIPRVCDQCGQPFLSWPSSVGRGEGRFCSALCRNRSPSTKPKQKAVATRFWKHVDTTGACWVWTAAKVGGDMSMGHGVMRLQDPVRNALVHRVSWELHYGPIPDGFCVLHRCDNPPCVRPDHLFLGTKADNTADMMRKGRKRGGFHLRARVVK